MVLVCLVLVISGSYLSNNSQGNILFLALGFCFENLGLLKAVLTIHTEHLCPRIFFKTIYF